MKIAGLQKMTLLDFPGKVACTVFLDGCNFRCPFCHNTPLLDGKAEAFMTEEELFTFLQKRKNILDGVCITGGEPTLQKDLPDFFRKIKDLGYAVKLDTNGYRPEILKSMVKQGLVDYVAMDIKNGPAHYSQTAGIKIDIKKIEESINFLVNKKVDYEFRTTVVTPLHNEQSLRDMAEWLTKTTGGKLINALHLQAFMPRETVCFEGLSTPPLETMERYKSLFVHVAQTVSLRGV